MNEVNNAQVAEVRRLNAERAKLELESQEIKLRLNSKWWQGTSLLKYMVSTVIATGLILVWVQSFLIPLSNHQKEINSLKSERDKIQNELLTAQKDNLTEKQAKLKADYQSLNKKQVQLELSYKKLDEKQIVLEKENQNLETMRRNLENENNQLTKRREELMRQNAILQNDKKRLQEDQIQLIKEKQELATRQQTLKSAITILKAVINKDGRDYFSILNHGDPINVLRGYGWKLPSTDYITWLGYYIRAKHEDVWQGKNILIAREFEVDDLKKNYPSRWEEKLKKVTDSTPLLALDYTYVGLQVDKNLAVGGTLYLKGGKNLDFYFPLSQWAKELNSILTSEYR